MAHSHVISLGNDCTAAFQLQYMDMLKGSGSPFDWLVTPFDALIKAVDDAGASFGIELSATAGWNVKCEKYGVIHVHDFPRSKDGTFVFSAEICREVREKLLHKTEKMLAAARTGNPLFVRYRGHGGPLGDPPDSIFNTADAEHLHSALAGLLGHSRFSVLLINPIGETSNYQFSGRIEVDHPAFKTEKIAIDPTVNTSAPWPEFVAALQRHLL